MATQGRNNAIDLLKILMAILVISIHTITPDGVFDYLLTQSVARVAVPFFFIAAGYYFTANPRSVDIKKAVFRLATLYIAWCVFYLPFEISDISTKPFSASGYLWESLYIFVKGWRHLWFMPALILGIAVYYLLHSSKKVNIIAFSLYAIGFMIQSNIEHGEYSILFYRNFLTFGFPLIAMGAALKKQRLSFKTGYPGLAVLLLLTVMLLLEGFSRLKLGIYDNDLLLLAPFVAVYTFVLTLNVNINLPFNIACTASSIYFVHYFFYLTLKSHIANQFLLFFAVSVLSLLFGLTLNRLSVYRRFFT